MARWSKVRWTEAGQIVEQLGWRGDLGDDAVAAPEAFFDKLRTEGRHQDAAYFLGQSLPRYEAVVWAADVVRHFAEAPDAAPPSPALRAALDWVAEPSEGRRRAAYEAASAAEHEDPGRMAALAAYFSGGSMSVEGQPAVPAPRNTAGKLGAAAVLMASLQTKDQKAALGWALDRGEEIAARGAVKP
jgi:hypothetical protein